jgi:hypothetical protein
MTLIELVLGMSVVGGILAAAYLALEAGTAGEDLLEWRRDAGQSARAALMLLGADLRSAAAWSRDDFIGMDRSIGELPADNLDFHARSWTPARPGEGDIAEVSWYADLNPRTGEIGLWRRKDPSPDHEPLAGGIREEIAAGIAGFTLEFTDGFRWYDTWGPPELSGGSFASSLFNSSGFPYAVRITLAFAAPERGPRPPAGAQARPPGRGRRRDRPGEPAADISAPLVFQTVVYLNLADHVTYSSSTSAAGGTEGGGAPAGGAPGSSGRGG